MKISDLFRKKTARKNILPALPIFDAASELRTEGAMKLSGKRAILVDVLLELLISVLSGYSFVYVFTSAFGLQVRAYLFFPALILLSFIVLLIARDKKIGVFLFLAAIGGAVVFSILKLQLLVGECTGIYDRLVSAFDEAYIFDYRRISQIGDYRDYVEKHGITDVLFMQYSLRGVFDNQNDNTLDTLLPKE